MKKQEGRKKNTLALGMSLQGTIGIRGALMGASRTDRIFALLDNGGKSTHAGPTIADKFDGGGTKSIGGGCIGELPSGDTGSAHDK